MIIYIRFKNVSRVVLAFIPSSVLLAVFQLLLSDFVSVLQTERKHLIKEKSSKQTNKQQKLFVRTSVV